MKIRTEIDPDSPGEIILRVPSLDEEAAALQTKLIKLVSSASEISVISGDREIYLPTKDILFFETFDSHVYAHTPKDCYKSDYKLYELEELLPRLFVRASKSTLINTSLIFSITRSLTGVAEAEFYGSKKKCPISRMYYHSVRDTIEETRLKK